MIAPLLFFVFAFAVDYLVCHYHVARERGLPGRQAMFSMLLALHGVATSWFVIQHNDWGVAVASILGAGAGAYAGNRSVSKSRQHGDPVVQTEVTRLAPGIAPTFQEARDAN